MSKNYLDNLTNTVLSAPLWIQEVVFLDIKKHLEENIPGSTEERKAHDVYPVFVPEVTFKGKKELETHEHNLDFNIYRLLGSIIAGERIVDITLNNFWTLEQTSTYLAFCIKNELVKNPENPVISASIFYLGNEIRLGEYVKRLDKINVEELDDVLRKQKIHNEEHPDQKIKIGEILIDMQFVANNDINKILNLKEEAKKRYIIPTAQTASSQNTPQNDDLQQTIDKLTKENNLLKDKLRAIFNIQNKKK